MQALETLCEIAASFYARGLAFGSTGNLSVRSGDQIWVTPTGRSLRNLRGFRTEEKVQDAVKAAEAEAQGRISAVLAPFRDALNDIPPEHFERLEALFSERLKNPPQVP